MKTTIFYFSATGNSLHAARLLAEGLGETVLLSMTGPSKNNRITVDTPAVGFVFPTHYFGLPPVVRECVQALELKGDQYIFAVNTCGSRYINSGLTQLAQLLREKGSKLDFGDHVEMVSSYIPLSDLPPPAKQQKRLYKADQKLQKMAKSILDRKKKDGSEYLKGIADRINRYWIRNLLPKADSTFSCSSDCTSCGICEKVCPVDNIRLTNGRPKWQQHCQECLACLHFCPVKSIQFGKKTAGRRRYKHPAVHVSDMIQGKAGVFR